MDQQQVPQLLSAIEAFLVPLRLGQGFVAERYDALCSTITAFGEAWAKSEVIPKQAASGFVDLLTVMDSLQSQYAGKDREQISQAAGNLFDLVQNACIGQE